MYIGINLQQSGLGTLRIDRDTVLALAGRFVIFPIIMVLVLLVEGADNPLLKETFYYSVDYSNARDYANFSGRS